MANGRCAECNRLRARAWYEANREQALAARSAYRDSNPEKVSAAVAASKSAKPDKYKEAKKAQYRRNASAIKARQKENRAHSNELQRTRRQANRDSWNAYQRARSASRTGAPMSPEDRRLSVEWAYIVMGDPCAYCGNPMEHIDHVDAVARGGHGEWDNLTAACAECNASKGAKPLLEFLRYRLTSSR